MGFSSDICKLILFSILNHNFVLMASNISSIHAYIENSTLDMNTCGLIGTDNGPTNRIIHGDLAKLGEFPWHAILSDNEDMKRYLEFAYCNGVLVHKHWILTARKCVIDRNTGRIKPYNRFNITLGSIDSKEFFSVHKVDRVVTDRYYPVALIGLTKEVIPVRTANNSGYRLNFICHPNNMSLNVLDEFAVLSSLGSVTHEDMPSNQLLHKAVLKIGSLSFCQNNSIGNPAYICSVDQKYLTCFRDFGSGLVQMDGNRAMIIGILIDFLPLYNNTCKPGPMVFVRMSYLIDFLMSVIKPDIIDTTLNTETETELKNKLTTDGHNQTEPDTTTLKTENPNLNSADKFGSDLFFRLILIFYFIDLFN